MDPSGIKTFMLQKTFQHFYAFSVHIRLKKKKKTKDKKKLKEKINIVVLFQLTHANPLLQYLPTLHLSQPLDLAKLGTDASTTHEM